MSIVSAVRTWALTGGLQTLTIVLVIMTGITGAVLGPIIARLARIDDPRVVGLTMGIASHGIGTARALQINEVAGAFSGLGMGLNGVLTAILLPLIFRLLRSFYPTERRDESGDQQSNLTRSAEAVRKRAKRRLFAVREYFCT